METTVAPTLLDKLVQKQQLAKLSDSQFASQLGILRQLWQLTRTGQRQINFTLLKAIVRTFPEMGEDVIRFLRDGDKPNEQQLPNHSVLSGGKPRSLWD